MAETKVKVRLDTRVAKKALDGLTRQAKSTGSRVSRDLKGAVTSGFGIGAGYGVGLAALKSSTAGGVGDVVGEALGGFGADLAESILGDLDDTARAKKRAREDMISDMSSAVGAHGWTQHMSRTHESLTDFYKVEEIGKGVIDRETRSKDEIGNIVTRLGSMIGDELIKAADHLYNKLPFVGSK